MSSDDLLPKFKKFAWEYCFSVDVWKDRLPFTRWLPKYRPQKIINDVIAGLTVGLTVLPQALAYANIARLPLVYGLYSAFMGSFMYCIFGMSKDITVGPTAIMSLLVADYGKPLTDNAGEDVLNDPRYAVLLAFFCGLIQIGLGILHLGFVTNYISPVVISGFTSASALTIGFGQVKNILGIKFHNEVFTLDLINIFRHIGETKWADCTLGICCLLVLVVLRMLKNKSQKTLDQFNSSSPLKKRAVWKTFWILGTARNALVVIAASGVTYALIQYDYDDYITITGNVTSGLPPLKVPDFQAPDISKYIIGGLVSIPLIGFLENIAIAKGFARQNGYRVESNQELIALGFCNLAGSFVSSFPTTGSFSRSAINSQSSVASPLGGIITGSLVLLALAFLTPAFYYIPKAALAAVILFSVFFMLDYEIIPHLWRIRKWELLTLVATFFPSLHLGVEYGTLIGIGVDLLMLLFPEAKPSYKVERSELLVICFKQGLHYPAIDRLQTILDEEALLVEEPKSVILDMRNINGIDFSIAEGLRESAKAFMKAGQKVAVVNVRKSVKTILDRAGVKNMPIYETVEIARDRMAATNPETDPAELEAFDTPL
ncbi:sodium-independent sulfate anion transporter-like [Acanthaster planci]|uniref:Sodium-independent sulfate anion transporter-like n=1 Tax=Acanthaster planci TaxID=133434 RepID=A0A8B7YCD3_ACAPL|nr:sodium-independent sulfate anion transporter-like [Acanthaster planci]XP_022089341.1 sodium-independent sulfate anion transporter-like [Acanthaster planci]